MRLRDSAKLLIGVLEKEIYSYDRYLNEELKVIGYSDKQHSDTVVSSVMSYSEWVNTAKQYDTIKIEGIETISEILMHFDTFNPKNIHMFYTQRASRSFDWHSDDVNVYLYVLRGTKWVEMEHKKVILEAGDSAVIPAGCMHRVYSETDTLALSVGY